MKIRGVIFVVCHETGACSLCSSSLKPCNFIGLVKQYGRVSETPCCLLPALPQKLVAEFCLILGRENFAGCSLDPQDKGSKFRGKFRSIFREKIRASKKIFRANFVLQTCHPNYFTRPPPRFGVLWRLPPPFYLLSLAQASLHCDWSCHIARKTRSPERNLPKFLSRPAFWPNSSLQSGILLN